MNPLESMLIDLYQSAREAEDQRLAARYAPVILFDASEPFLPLAAGITLFRQDGESSSMRRQIQLNPAGFSPAQMAIEYAIWWDWDIHHLYELEHIWVYVGAGGEVQRVEGSWHGDFHPLTVRLEGDHPVVLSEPGKHAFASDVGAFQERRKTIRRSETLNGAGYGHVLINSMFRGKIRGQVFDHVLARSYLAQQAFEPEWDFSKRFSFRPEMLVPWNSLSAWIPRRVNAVLESLERSLPPSAYRAQRVLSVDGSRTSLETAERAGADFVAFDLGCDEAGRPVPDLKAVLGFCSKIPMGGLLMLRDERVLPAVAGLLQENKDAYDFLLVTSDQPGWLEALKKQLPRLMTVLPAGEPGDDALQMQKAVEAGAALVNLLPGGDLSPERISRFHQAGLGVIAGPFHTRADWQSAERAGADVVWVDDPENLAPVLINKSTGACCPNF